MGSNYRISTLFFLFCLLFGTISCKKAEIRPIRFVGDYNRDFNDLNDLHLSAAHRIGIVPLESREGIGQQKKMLKEISSNKYYELDELTHSIPWLVPQAYSLLDRIGINFSDSLKSRNAPRYKLIVTSVTRTREDVTRLGSTNINASMNSTHLYGTTFDISWKRFRKEGKDKREVTEEDLKKVLACVLRDLRKEGLCYVKHERKQACFHITAR